VGLTEETVSGELLLTEGSETNLLVEEVVRVGEEDGNLSEADLDVVFILTPDLLGDTRLRDLSEELALTNLELVTVEGHRLHTMSARASVKLKLVTSDSLDTNGTEVSTRVSPRVSAGLVAVVVRLVAEVDEKSIILHEGRRDDVEDLIGDTMDLILLTSETEELGITKDVSGTRLSVTSLDSSGTSTNGRDSAASISGGVMDHTELVNASGRSTSNLTTTARLRADSGEGRNRPRANGAGNGVTRADRDRGSTNGRGEEVTRSTSTSNTNNSVVSKVDTLNELSLDTATASGRARAEASLDPSIARARLDGGRDRTSTALSTSVGVVRRAGNRAGLSTEVRETRLALARRPRTSSPGRDGSRPDVIIVSTSGNRGIQEVTVTSSADTTNEDNVVGGLDKTEALADRERVGDSNLRPSETAVVRNPDVVGRSDGGSVGVGSRVENITTNDIDSTKTSEGSGTMTKAREPAGSRSNQSPSGERARGDRESIRRAPDIVGVTRITTTENEDRRGPRSRRVGGRSKGSSMLETRAEDINEELVRRGGRLGERVSVTVDHEPSATVIVGLPDIVKKVRNVISTADEDKDTVGGGNELMTLTTAPVTRGNSVGDSAVVGVGGGLLLGLEALESPGRTEVIRNPGIRNDTTVGVTTSQNEGDSVEAGVGVGGVVSNGSSGVTSAPSGGIRDDTP